MSASAQRARVPNLSVALEVTRRVLAPLVVVAMLGGAGCGAGDEPAPYSPPPPSCPEADDYLAELYAVVDSGGVQALATTIRERIPDEVRRDLLDAILRLLTAFEEGSFEALGELPTAEGAGLQVTLGEVVRWLVSTSPRAPNAALLGVLRTTVGTCEGAPVFALLAEAIADRELMTGLIDTLASPGLADALSGLDFEGASGRAAVQLLTRNLLVSASSDAFDVAGILGLLGLLVDLEQPPYAGLADGLVRLLDADGLPRLQGLLVCLRHADSELELGGFLYDLLTSGLLAQLTEPGRVDLGALLPQQTLDLLAQVVRFLAEDALARRALTPTVLTLLDPALAPAVLGDVATLLEREALSGVVDLVVDLVSRRCQAPAVAP